MSIITKLRGTLVFAALAASGCSAYDPSVEGDPSDMVDTETQQIWKASWSPIARSVLGMARSPNGRPHVWFSNGTAEPTYCAGDATLPGADNFCVTERVFYSPLPAKQIRAVTIKQDNSRVVAWYSNTNNPTSGWYSAGTSTALDSSTGLTVFTPAAKPGGGLFTMNMLVDADHNRVDGRYYYYWNTRTCDIVAGTCTPDRIYRTIGSLTDADAYSAATEVNFFHRDSSTAARLLVGVAIYNWEFFPGMFQTYYSAYYGDGFVNHSTSSLDFNQP